MFITCILNNEIRKNILTFLILTILKTKLYNDLQPDLNLNSSYF
jgi:hypothetical protein